MESKTMFRIRFIGGTTKSIAIALFVIVAIALSFYFGKKYQMQFANTQNDRVINSMHMVYAHEPQYNSTRYYVVIYYIRERFTSPISDTLRSVLYDRDFNLNRNYNYNVYLNTREPYGQILAVWDENWNEVDRLEIELDRPYFLNALPKYVDHRGANYKWDEDNSIFEVREFFTNHIIIGIDKGGKIRPLLRYQSNEKVYSANMFDVNDDNYYDCVFSSKGIEWVYSYELDKDLEWSAGSEQVDSGYVVVFLWGEGAPRAELYEALP